MRQTDSSLEPDRAVSPAEHDLNALADAICRRGLAAPAIFFIESVKPLNFIGSQMLHALTPLLSLLADPERIEALAAALEDRDTAERLLQKIEEREQQPSNPN
ncbi:MAG: hypothetical protein N2111_02800 [Candidatus Sumerlaeaceae bacterium]|nr:hypothetical protein [Candidatus Sumerlaeaceae bacterium]